PRHQYFLGARWHVLERLWVDGQLKGVGSLYVSDGMPRQSYATVDLRVAYRLFHRLDLSVKLDNITDARYQIMRGYEMPGFTAMGGVKFTF
ncbi:MAG: TonB-dependent receptor, partial [Muribaculaceae bacterium]|nr:TonB-dependent receptor [Muribaculaceae bacterium]